MQEIYIEEDKPQCNTAEQDGQQSATERSLTLTLNISLGVASSDQPHPQQGSSSSDNTAHHTYTFYCYISFCKIHKIQNNHVLSLTTVTSRKLQNTLTCYDENLFTRQNL